MNLRHDMIAAALRLRRLKLWDYIDDSMIYAVALTDGSIGYCCMMGHGGQHYGLGFYRGQDGFNTYYSTIKSKDLSAEEMNEMMATYSLMNCDFVNASDGELTKEEKDFVKSVAASEQIKMSRPLGWPSIYKMEDGYFYIGRFDDKDMTDLTTALKASCEVAQRIAQSTPEKLGFDPLRKYASPAGGKVIPLLISQPDGTFEWSTTVTPPAIPTTPQPTPYTDDAEAKRVSKLPHCKTYQFKLFHAPAKIGDREKSYNPWMAILLDEGAMQPVPFPDRSESTKIPVEILSSMASFFARHNMCPATIKVNDDISEGFISDFCEKTGIKLKRVESMREFDAVYFFLCNAL